MRKNTPSLSRLGATLFAGSLLFGLLGTFPVSATPTIEEGDAAAAGQTPAAPAAPAVSAESAGPTVTQKEEPVLAQVGQSAVAQVEPAAPLMPKPAHPEQAAAATAVSGEQSEQTRLEQTASAPEIRREQSQPERVEVDNLELFAEVPAVRSRAKRATKEAKHKGAERKEFAMEWAAKLGSYTAFCKPAADGRKYTHKITGTGNAWQQKINGKWWVTLYSGGTAIRSINVKPSEPGLTCTPTPKKGGSFPPGKNLGGGDPTVTIGLHCVGSVRTGIDSVGIKYTLNVRDASKPSKPTVEKSVSGSIDLGEAGPQPKVKVLSGGKVVQETEPNFLNGAFTVTTANPTEMFTIKLGSVETPVTSTCEKKGDDETGKQTDQDDYGDYVPDRPGDASGVSYSLPNSARAQATLHPGEKDLEAKCEKNTGEGLKYRYLALSPTGSASKLSKVFFSTSLRMRTGGFVDKLDITSPAGVTCQGLKRDKGKGTWTPISKQNRAGSRDVVGFKCDGEILDYMKTLPLTLVSYYSQEKYGIYGKVMHKGKSTQKVSIQIAADDTSGWDVVFSSTGNNNRFNNESARQLKTVLADLKEKPREFFSDQADQSLYLLKGNRAVLTVPTKCPVDDNDDKGGADPNKPDPANPGANPNPAPQPGPVPGGGTGNTDSSGGSGPGTPGISWPGSTLPIVSPSPTTPPVAGVNQTPALPAAPTPANKPAAPTPANKPAAPPVAGVTATPKPAGTPAQKPAPKKAAPASKVKTPQVDALAHTGTNNATLAAFAFLLLAVGAVLRRRSARLVAERG